MAKNCRIPGRWMAFVPFLQMVIRGRLAEFPFSGNRKKFWNLGMHLACCSMSIAIFSGILGCQIVQSLSWMSKSGVEYTPQLMEILLWHWLPMILCGFCYLLFLIGYCVRYFRSLYRIFRLFCSYFPAGSLYTSVRTKTMFLPNTYFAEAGWRLKTHPLPQFL